MGKTTDMLRQHAVDLHKAGVLDLNEPNAYPVWQAADLIDHLETQLQKYLSGEEIIVPQSVEHARAMIDLGRAFLKREDDAILQT